MDHLDLAGVLTTPPQWNLPAFEQQDAIYLSSSRQMLEPIMEETSEDEEYALNSWSQYEQQSSDAEGGTTTEGESICGGANSTGGGGASFWSSAESDTGSVIRIEVTKDNDSNSERDFLCPAKRPRRSEETLSLSLPEEEVILRRPLYNGIEKNNSLERFLNYENYARDSWGTNSQQRSSVGSRRGFDDFYSDSDSLSYNSLSRSSSLIQFESLERQLLMQEQHNSMNSLGNSSPSLLSFETQEDTQNKTNSANNSANNSRRGSQSSLLKKYESLDGRLHQTYYDLDKLNFDDMDSKTRNTNLKLQTHMAELRSDSESSSEGSEGSCRPQNNLSPSEAQEGEFMFKKYNRCSTDLKGKKGKNSAENLSEDSGYCEPSMAGCFGLRRSKSQTLLKNYEKFSEEEEEMENKSLICNNNYKQMFKDEDIEAQKHSLDFIYTEKTNTTNNTNSNNNNNNTRHETHSPHLEFIRHKQRTETHSPSPVSSEVSTSSSLSTNSNNSSTSTSSSTSSSSASSSSSATTCASKASFTWLKKPSAKHLDHHEPQELANLPYEFSLNDLCEVKTSNEENVKIFNGICTTQQQQELIKRDHKENECLCARESLKELNELNEYEDNLKCQKCGEYKKFPSLSFQLNEVKNLLLHKNLKEFKTKTRDFFTINLDKKYNNNLMLNWPDKTCSLPYDLNDIGRLSSNKNKENSLEKSEEIEKENFGEIKKSSSWCGCPLKLEQAEEFLIETKNLNLLHQSYHNLALLDLEQEPLKKMSDKRISSDYETEIVCKNNFLLDELSAHYDRTASILNDQAIDQVDYDIKFPQAPLRQNNRKSSKTNCLQAEEDMDKEEDHIQHVQLVIRQPPARQKRSNQQQAENKCNSLNQDLTFNSIMLGGVGSKTFDQDPTILKTSYAQSLEKCNFDCKELSSQDLTKTRSLPKRRFHSQANNAKKKSLVSSTPNLNAYDFQHQDDIEDDMFVSSAHTSMHQLPLAQTQKPLGILLPAGSRTSFGKEVSFCPVVSKYCWQEQSSEECTEGNEVEGDLGAREEESEDELLDNADATVIYNTKENEMIAAKYNEEYLKREQQQQMENKEEELKKEKTIIKELQNKQQENVLVKNKEQDLRESETKVNETKVNETRDKEQENNNSMNLRATKENETIETNTNCKRNLNNNTTTLVSLTTNVNNETLNSNADRNNAVVNQQKILNNKTNKPTIVVARPLSIQLPILSEPPINRAHHILYASQQMLDNFQKQQENEQSQHLKSQSTQNLTKMSGKMSNDLQIVPDSKTKLNNNNDVVKSKFKHEEKHPNSKGFLSRFANGFRFSLRRNKKKLPQKENPSEQQSETITKLKTNSLPAPNKQADFIHIPLKGPLPEKSQNNTTNGNSGNKNTTLFNKQKGAKIKTENKIEKVTGKPPLPPAHQQLQQQQLQKLQSAQSSPQQQPQLEVGLSRFYTDNCHEAGAPQQNSLSAATQQFLTNEQQQQNQQYFTTIPNSENNPQSCANHHQHQLNQNQIEKNNEENMSTILNTNNTATYVEFTSPSRATVSQKTQMFNNLITNQNDPQQQQQQQHQPKIGLIETNLDTHETIITGKTRSLINIGPQQQHQQRFSAGNKRLHGPHNNSSNRHQSYIHHGHDADDDDVYDDNDDDEVVVRPDGTVVVIKNAGTNGSSQSQAAAQIVSVRRPHKSMEFLLDKENQKDVMPPENELQKSHDHNPAALSEHQLRIQASLQRLNIPDWFRQYNQNQKSPDGAGGASTYKPGNFTRKRTQDSGRWVGLNSKTTSLSSLGSQRSDRSPLLLSPSAHSHHGGQTTQHVGQHGQHVTQTAGTGASGGAFSRWSTSHLNSSQTSPSVSQRGSFSRGGPINSSFISVNSGHSVIRNSMRQPYLGWRSQEKLSQRTAHERLASSLLSQQQRTSPTTNQTVVASLTATTNNDKLQPVTPEIQSSIKEVTSAIVHYVNDQTNQQRSRSTSPNSRKCWLESSFVGTRPLDSPQTPIIENTPLISAAQAAAAGAIASSSSSSSTLRPSLLNSNNNNININNNNNNLQYVNHNIDGSLNLSTFTGNDIQLTRMNGGLNNGTSSSSAAGVGVVNLGVGESKRKTFFHLTKIQEC